MPVEVNARCLSIYESFNNAYQMKSEQNTEIIHNEIKQTLCYGHLKRLTLTFRTNHCFTAETPGFSKSLVIGTAFSKNEGDMSW